MSKAGLLKNKFIAYAAILMLLIFFHYLNLLKPVENFISYIFLPIQSELYNQGNILSQKWENANLNNKELAYQNQILKTELQKLIINKSKLLELEAENSILREQLNFIKEQKYQYLVAKIVGNNLHHDINSYILDKGADDGIKIGQAVVVQEGIIVGKISQVFPKSSELLLLIDSQSVLAAVVQNEENSQGVVEGQYGLSIRMNLIPQDEEVNHGDLVITSGIEQYVPRGLVIGQVEQVEAEVNELFQSAIILPAADFKKLNIVTIIIDDENK
jgi:rod shape-determining protein MreC